MADALVEFIRADRQRTAYILLGLSAVLLVLCGWTAVMSNRGAAGAEEKENKKADEPPPDDDAAKSKVKAPDRDEYVAGAVFAGAGCLVALCVGGWLLVSLVPTEAARQRTEARIAILCAGGLLGAVLMLAAVAYFYLWGGAWADWLDKNEAARAKFAIAPLLAVAVGAALMFLAIQPARAEERNNRLLRQLIYGANLGLSVLLLLVVLVAVNLILGPRLPNKLDVTATGFYSLTPGSVEFLQKLPDPVKAYVVLSDNRRETEDVRRLLQKAADVSGGKFTAKFLSQVSDPREYQALAGKYPVLQTNEVGVLLTVGEDEKRHGFIRDDEFLQREGGGNPMAPQPPTRSFVGESRLIKELLFLVEGDKKAVVYFTQGAGELSVDGERGEVRPAGSAQMLKEYLGRNYLDVRPLKFDREAPKVPDDAAVVVVAQPTEQLAEPNVAAIRQYMTEARAGKKGKLVVLAGAAFGPPPKSEARLTGLEGLLQEFDVRLDRRVLMNSTSRELPNPFAFVAGFGSAAVKAKNPIALALGDKAQFLSVEWREVVPVNQKEPGFNPAYKTVPLLYALNGEFTWAEERRPADKELETIIKDLLDKRNGELRAVKSFRADAPRPVAVAASEGDAGRVVVVGNSYMVSDAYAQQLGGEPLSFDLVSGCVDWLRDRPPLRIEIKAKKYQEFKFPVTTDRFRGIWLPLLLTVVVVAGLGTSVWVIRRRS
jgi:hypothetical protein